ncbi:MAG: hypothetical protein ACYCOU_02355 [Sulfobacillus sp.]
MSPSEKDLEGSVYLPVPEPKAHWTYDGRIRVLFVNKPVPTDRPREWWAIDLANMYEHACQSGSELVHWMRRAISAGELDRTLLRRLARRHATKRALSVLWRAGAMERHEVALSAEDDVAFADLDAEEEPVY